MRTPDEDKHKRSFTAGKVSPEKADSFMEDASMGSAAKSGDGNGIIKMHHVQMKSKTFKGSVTPSKPNSVRWNDTNLIQQHPKIEENYQLESSPYFYQNENEQPNVNTN